MRPNRGLALLMVLTTIPLMTAGTASASSARVLPQMKPGSSNTIRPGAATPCLEPGGVVRIATACKKAVERARARWNLTNDGGMSASPLISAPSISSPNAVESPGGDTLEITKVGDGSPKIYSPYGDYSNNDSIIYCGSDPGLVGGEGYASCAKEIFNDAVTGTKAPPTNESTDVVLDACGHVAGGSSIKNWYWEEDPEEIRSNYWVGGKDMRLPATDAEACPGTWTILYSYTQTFTNHETLTAESTGTFVVTLAPAPTSEELYGLGNPANPNYKLACTGKPVNCATGDETLSQTDLSVGGLGIPLTFTRTYNTLAAVQQSTPGTLGYGWKAPYSDHLLVSTNEGTTTVIVVQSNGSTARFTGDGTPGELSGSVWSQAKLVLNEGGTYTYTLPSQETFDFNASGELLAEADANGNATTLHRNAEGVLESVSDAAGRTLTFAYNTEGLIESVTDPMGHTVKYGYEHGDLTTVTLPGANGPNWDFKYDSHNRITAITNGLGGTTTNEYDSSNRVISQTDPLGDKLTFEYGIAKNEAEDPQTIITNDATGGVTQEIFDHGYEPVTITHGYGTAYQTIEYFYYNDAGDLIKVTNGDGHSTKYTYDAEGNRTSMLDADKYETKWSYDSHHNVISMTLPDGETTTTKRDIHGNPEIVERKAPNEETQVTTYKYNAQGELKSFTDPLERTWTYEYDPQGDRTSETDPEGDRRTWEYNQDSQQIASVSPKGNVEGAEPAQYQTTIERDEQGRPVAVTNPLGNVTTYTYDADGNVKTMTNPDGNTTTYSHNADNELVATEQPNGTVTKTSYDSNGQVISQTNGAGQTTKYIRNVLGQVTEVVDPNELKTLKEYDKAGNLAKLTDMAGRTTAYTYDPAGRLTEVSYSDEVTPTVKYGYNGDGYKTSMSDGSGETTYTYDTLDRMTESMNGHGDVVKYEYNLANELTGITYPNGKTITRAYDGAGHLESVTDWLGHTTSFTYDPNSMLTRAAFPAESGNADTYAYNTADQLTEVTMSKGAETLASLTYTRDKNGQVESESRTGLPGAESVGYEYDTNGRLVKAGETTYEYDAANDPTKIGGETFTYNSVDEVEASPNAKYTYNEVGERTEVAPSSGEPTMYTYDQAGNLIAVERRKEGKTPGISSTFTYDGSGLRVSQTTERTTSYLTWQMNESLPLLLSDGTRSYIYGPDNLPIEQIDSEEHVQYLHHGQAGSTRLITSATGNVEASYSYSPYGNVEAHSGSASTTLGYDGQYANAGTGLIYLRARVYDPGTAQFMSVDPAVETTSAPYSYAADNPLNLADPSGLCGVGSVSEAIESVNPFSEENCAYQAVNEIVKLLGGNAEVISEVTGVLAAGFAATGYLAPVAAALTAVSAAAGAYAAGENAANGQAVTAAIDALGSVLGSEALAYRVIGSIASAGVESAQTLAALSADLRNAANAEEVADILDKFGYSTLAGSILNNC